MTDEQIIALVQQAVNETIAATWSAVNDELDRRLQPFVDVLTAMAGGLERLDDQAAVAAARLASPTPPQLGEVVVRLESGPSTPSTKRIVRDAAGDIAAIEEFPAVEPRRFLASPPHRSP